MSKEQLDNIRFPTVNTEFKMIKGIHWFVHWSCIYYLNHEQTKNGGEMMRMGKKKLSCDVRLWLNKVPQLTNGELCTCKIRLHNCHSCRNRQGCIQPLPQVSQNLQKVFSFHQQFDMSEPTKWKELQFHFRTKRNLSSRSSSY